MRAFLGFSALSSKGLQVRLILQWRASYFPLILFVSLTRRHRDLETHDSLVYEMPTWHSDLQSATAAKDTWTGKGTPSLRC